MHFKSLTLATLLSAVSALPSSNNNQHAARQTSNSFTVMAARSASPIHFLPLNARGSHFWLGGKTTSYCPDEVTEMGGQCPPGDVTGIAGQSSLDVMVPGGQQIYVDNHGALTFTIPHSGYIPPGSSVGPFEYEPAAPGQVIGHWYYTGQGASGFMACPVPVANATEGAALQKSPQWQVYAALKNATVPSGNVGDCLGFSAMAVARNTTTPAAWEYI
ncbi:hypothetical protein FE257_000943 [Aspergillus nanangensis]|uniref:IgE-binding protein n=1 Tax=Aspergillus nanangensis TaxID=2582783 RepID=A0AAD4GPW4_ASPNN|nr:hypothetical protein FE257_000943 [Aspergillus nanangensis]